jgi:molybdate transport system ATP-binding protein
MFLSFQNASIFQAEKPIFSGFNWQINDHENWAIIGEMGSGKTTILQALAGKKRVLGNFNTPFISQNERHKDVVSMAANDYAGFRLVHQSIQYYQQRFNSFDAELAPTVWEFLTDRVRPAGTIDKNSAAVSPNFIAEEILIEKCNLLRISHLLDRKLTSLSNGETRRALMTHALLKSPKLLLLDNPFVGLDVASRGILHDVLQTINQSGTKVVLTTTVAEIPAFVSHILVLKAGKIDWQGAKQDFIVENFNQKSEEIIDEKILQAIDNELIVPFDEVLHLRKINIKYGSVQVLKDVSWQIKVGDKWALLGPNGSGKSTLLSLITADNPQSYANDFEIFGRNRKAGMSIWDIKKQIGFVSPEMHLYADKSLSVFKIIASGLFDTAGLFQALKPADEAKINRILSLLKLHSIAHKTLLNCSTGEQRMVFLGRALVKNPPVLILDEPCQGLDENHTLAFKTIIERLCLNKNRTLIYVTHYANEIPASVTKTLQLAAGEVVL